MRYVICRALRTSKRTSMEFRRRRLAVRRSGLCASVGGPWPGAALGATDAGPCGRDMQGVMCRNNWMLRSWHIIR